MGRQIRLFAALAITSSVIGLALRADSRDAADIEAASAWAGSYWFAEPNVSTSYGLTITPQGGYTLYAYDCFGTSVESRGIVAYREGLLRLHPRASFGNSNFTPRALIPMKRGERQYLVDGAHFGGPAVFAHEGNPEGLQIL